MKKFISIILTLAFAFTFVTGCSAAEQTEKFTLEMKIGNPVMTINGAEKNIDESGTVPVVENGRTLVPVRAVIESMGGNVEWDGETDTARVSLGDDTVTLVVGSETALFNAEEHTLDVAPKIINERTMLPIRFIAESFKFGVDWDEAAKTITITKTVASTPESAAPDSANTAKTLVVYYSATGTTEKIAEYIKNAANADIFELVPAEKYSSDDLDWTDKTSRVNIEHDDESKRDVKLESTTVPNFEQYDTVFLGYPIWWGIAAWPVDSFVTSNDFSDKTVIPFCTSASSGIGSSGKLLSDKAGTGNWQEGKRFGAGTTENDVKAWVETLTENN